MCICDLQHGRRQAKFANYAAVTTFAGTGWSGPCQHHEKEEEKKEKKGEEMIPDSWHGTGTACRWIPSDRSRRYLWYTFNLYTPYSPIHAEGEYPNALCFLEERSRAPTRNVWNTHVWSAHFRRSSYTELAPRRVEVWPCLIHTSTKRTLMSRRPGNNTKLKSLAIYSIMNIFYGILYTDRYHIFIIFCLT